MLEWRWLSKHRHIALKDVDRGSFLLLVLRRIAFLAHGLSAHLDAVGVVNQAVENAISDGQCPRFASLFWPLTWDNLGQRQTISASTLRSPAKDALDSFSISAMLNV